MIPDDSSIEISRLTLAELRADESGTAIEQLADLIIEAFRELPWNEHFSASRIHFGLGVELMRQEIEPQEKSSAMSWARSWP
jgi:hypothetical protein